MDDREPLEPRPPREALRLVWSNSQGKPMGWNPGELYAFNCLNNYAAHQRRARQQAAHRWGTPWQGGELRGLRSDGMLWREQRS